ncbi:hypothetical protein DFP72DRAFT_1073322 [Ephemerocybe angulata]|uniref:Uncharacterized protein n=1 Tax=Ephemerocybe angulata TaxID=980116 RepID=A0A8H6HLG2_9AGAR|nr:hypothetical protein DFP72DRAFT_1073322 [Tulosesus angulatus]
MSLEKHTLFRLQEREDHRREEHKAAAREIGSLGRAILMREGQFHNTKRTIRGLLFPSLAARPFLVSVPVRRGYHFGASAHHCEYETWVPHCPPLRRSWDPFGFDEEGCHSFRVAGRNGNGDNHASEDGGGSAHDCYVAFYVPKHTAGYEELPKNRALRVPKLRGNVLVMRMNNGLRDAFAVDVKIDEGLDILAQKAAPPRYCLGPIVFEKSVDLTRHLRGRGKKNPKKKPTACTIALFSHFNVSSMSTSPNGSPMAFNGQAIHDQFLLRDDYSAVPDYRHFVTWVKDPSAGNADMVAYKDEIGPDAAPSAGVITVVGTVTADRPTLKATGNRSEKYNKPLSDAKMQFTLGGATIHSRVLGEDWDQSVDALAHIQDLVAKSPQRNHFIITENGKKCLRMNWLMFSMRDEPYDPNNRDDKTTSLPVPNDVKRELDSLKETHRLNPWPFFHTDGTPIPAAVLQSSLLHAVVEVSFTLHHFFMNMNDTYSARLVQLRVLKRPPPVPVSRYQSALRNGTAYVPPSTPTRTRSLASVSPSSSPSPGATDQSVSAQVPQPQVPAASSASPAPATASDLQVTATSAPNTTQPTTPHAADAAVAPSQATAATVVAATGSQPTTPEAAAAPVAIAQVAGTKVANPEATLREDGPPPPAVAAPTGVPQAGVSTAVPPPVVRGAAAQAGVAAAPTQVEKVGATVPKQATADASGGDDGPGKRGRDSGEDAGGRALKTRRTGA